MSDLVIMNSNMKYFVFLILFAGMISFADCLDCSNVEVETYPRWNQGDNMMGRNGVWRFDKPTGASLLDIIVTFDDSVYSGPGNTWRHGACTLTNENEISNSPVQWEMRYQTTTDANCLRNGQFEIGYSNVDYYSWGEGLASSFKINGVEQCGDGSTGTTEAPVTTEETEATTETEEPETTTTTEEPETTETPGTTQDPSTCTTKHNYAEVLSKSILFYKAQRSGKLPDNDIPWRRDSFTNDRTEEGVDLSGGYFDAGDYVKFNFPAAAATTVLAWGIVDFAEGYKFAGLYDEGLKTLKWATDYFMKCHTGTEELYGQCGIGGEDHSYWGRPEDYYTTNPGRTNPRPCFKIDGNNPGSDLAGETAAALAATSIAYQDTDATYSAELLLHAEQLYAFAKNQKGDYSNSITDAAGFYLSYSGFKDELTWAAAWLFKATGEQNYLTDAEYFWNSMGKTPYEFTWDNKAHGVAVLLSQLSDSPSKSTYQSNADDFCQHMKSSQLRTEERNLVFIQPWGSNRHAANVAFVCLAHSKASGEFNSFSREQIDLLLGDEAAGIRSFVVGYGFNPPQRPHHRSSSCEDSPAVCGWGTYGSSAPNPHILVGALVGGVRGIYDTYEDKRDDYVRNEVALDYNAGFQSALAALLQLQQNNECNK